MINPLQDLLHPISEVVDQNVSGRLSIPQDTTRQDSVEFRDLEVLNKWLPRPRWKTVMCVGRFLTEVRQSQRVRHCTLWRSLSDSEVSWTLFSRAHHRPMNLPSTLKGGAEEDAMVLEVCAPELWSESPRQGLS